MNVIRRRRLKARSPHHAVDDELKVSGKLIHWPHSHSSDEKEPGGEVVHRLTRFGAPGDVIMRLRTLQLPASMDKQMAERRSSTVPPCETEVRQNTARRASPPTSAQRIIPVARV